MPSVDISFVAVGNGTIGVVGIIPSIRIVLSVGGYSQWNIAVGITIISSVKLCRR